MNDRRGSTARTVLLTALASVSLLAFLIRVTAIAEPLGIDQGFWASAAREMSRGQVLYRDVWDHKPPGAFFMYLGAFSLLGWAPSSVAWMDILAAAVTALLLFILGRRMGGVIMGAVAATLYTALTLPSWQYGHGGFLERSVAETFISIGIAVAAWCAAGLTRRRSTVLAAGLGLMAGAAVVFKPNAGIYLPALLLWVALYADTTRAQLFRIVLTSLLAALIVPGVTVAWLWSRGALADAQVALIAFNRAYVGEGFTIAGYALDFSKAVWLRMKTDPLWSAGAIATLVVLWDLRRSKRLDPAPALAVAWGGAAALVIIANGARLYNTYFIQALPPLALLAAWLFAAAPRRTRVHTLAASAAIVVMAVLLVRRHYADRVYDYARADLDQLIGRGDRTDYLLRFGGYANDRGYSALANEQLHTYVRERTQPGDPIYFFGINSSGIYFATDRPMAQRFLRVNVFVASSFAEPGFELASVAHQIAAKRPVYLIFERLHTPTELGRQVDSLEQQPDIIALLQSYRFEKQVEDFRLYRRVASGD